MPLRPEGNNGGALEAVSVTEPHATSPVVQFLALSGAYGAASAKVHATD